MAALEVDLPPVQQRADRLQRLVGDVVALVVGDVHAVFGLLGDSQLAWWPEMAVGIRDVTGTGLVAEAEEALSFARIAQITVASRSLLS